MAEFDQNAYIQDYCKKMYDRITFQVPKGMRQEIKKQAARKGYTSVNSYLMHLVESDK